MGNDYYTGIGLFIPNIIFVKHRKHAIQRITTTNPPPICYENALAAQALFVYP